MNNAFLNVLIILIWFVVIVITISLLTFFISFINNKIIKRKETQEDE